MEGKSKVEDLKFQKVSGARENFQELFFQRFLFCHEVRCDDPVLKQESVEILALKSIMKRYLVTSVFAVER
jgi:hypothetical protein